MKNLKDVKKYLEEVFSSIEKDLKELSEYIFNNPELGNQEKLACAKQIKLLKKYKFKVEKNFCNIKTAYRATYKSVKNGPKIAMLSEYDALPELGHACGHNLIATVGVGSGILIKYLIEEFGGQIDIIGTPAEENEGAKVTMSNMGIFDDYDVAMMAHPMTMNADSINTMAINAYTISFKGKATHAAATPYEGKNALDAMINFFNLVNALRQQTKDDAKIHGIITNGGSASNVIPEYTEAEFCVRAFKSDYLEKLCEQFLDCAKGAAIGTGTQFSYVKSEFGYKDTVSNLTLAKIHKQSKEEVGQKVLKLSDKPMLGSSDIGDVSHCCPCIQSTFDITKSKEYSLHTREFLRCAGSKFGLKMAFSEILAFGLTAYRLLNEKSLLQEIKKEFDNIVKK